MAITNGTKVKTLCWMFHYERGEEIAPGQIGIVGTEHLIGRQIVNFDDGSWCELKALEGKVEIVQESEDK